MIGKIITSLIKLVSFDYVLKHLHPEIQRIIRKILDYSVGALALVTLPGFKELVDFLISNMDKLTSIFTLILLGLISLAQSKLSDLRNSKK